MRILATKYYIEYSLSSNKNYKIAVILNSLSFHVFILLHIQLFCSLKEFFFFLINLEIVVIICEGSIW